MQKNFIMLKLDGYQYYMWKIVDSPQPFVFVKETYDN